VSSVSSFIGPVDKLTRDPRESADGRE